MRDFSKDPIPYSPDHENYIPKGITTISSRRPVPLSLVDRLILLILLVFLLSYFAFGLWMDDLPIPSLRTNNVSHFHGISIWLLFGAFLCYVFYLIKFSTKETPDDELLRAPFFLPSEFLPLRGGKPALALVCLSWLLFLASLASIFFARG